MRDPNPYRCDGDGCTATKKPSNGWFLVIKDHPASLENEQMKGIYIVPWNDSVADMTGVKHFCGAHCALKSVGQELVKVYQLGDQTGDI